MAAQIKDEVSVLSMKIIEKLDASIDSEDRKAVRKLQEELEAYWKGAQRHINSGVELGRELDKLKEQVPKEAIDIKA